MRKSNGNANKTKAWPNLALALRWWRWKAAPTLYLTAWCLRDRSSLTITTWTCCQWLPPSAFAQDSVFEDSRHRKQVLVGVRIRRKPPSAWRQCTGNMASNGEKKLVRSKSGLRMVTVDERIQSPLMMSEPQWTPDSSVSFVGLCTVTLVVKVVVFDEIRHYMYFFERRCYSGEGWRSVNVSKQSITISKENWPLCAFDYMQVCLKTTFVKVICWM